MNISYRYSLNKDLVIIKKLLSSANSDDRNIDNDNFLLAIDDAQIVACIRIKTLDKGVFELSSLVVREDYRNQKVGRKIVSEILKSDNRRPIYLLTKAELENFYKSNNFRIIEPARLPKVLFKEYKRITNLPFAKDLKVIAMAIY